MPAQKMVLLRTVRAVACYEQSICPYALTLNFLFDTVGLSDVFPGGTRHRHTHTQGMCTPVSLGCRCPGHRLTGAGGTCQVCAVPGSQLPLCSALLGEAWAMGV